MKFTPSATPTHTLALPAELATAEFATHLKAGLELHGAEHLILYLRPCMKERVVTKCHLFSELTAPKSAYDVLCGHNCVFAFSGLIFFFLFYMLDTSLKPGGINSSFN